MFNYLFLAGALLQLTASPAPSAANSQTAQVYTAQHQVLDVAARERAFDFVWKSVNDGYVDPAMRGLDWAAIGQRYRPLALQAPDDHAFWTTLDRMTGELGDSHTRVLSPRQYANYKVKQGLSLGMRVREIDGALIVAHVGKDSPAAAQGIQSGDKLIEIDGLPAAHWWEINLATARKNSTERARRLSVARLLGNGSPEMASQGMSFKLERIDGTVHTATVERAKMSGAPAVYTRTLPSGYGYIGLSSFDPTLEDELLDAIDKVKAAPGLVLDLRGNGGGSLNTAAKLMSQLINGRIYAGKSLTRGDKRGRSGEFSVQGRPHAYRGKLVILINEGSASSSEMTAITLQSTGRAKVVGETSCGCMMGYRERRHVPGGGALTFSELDFEFAGGGRIEGLGVVPDVQVPLTRAALAARKDEMFDAAIAMLDQLTGKAVTPAP